MHGEGVVDGQQPDWRIGESGRELRHVGTHLAFARRGREGKNVELGFGRRETSRNPFMLGDVSETRARETEPPGDPESRRLDGMCVQHDHGEVVRT